MRVNVYAEEMTDKVEIIKKGKFTGVRFWLYLPVTKVHEGVIVHHKGPFIHEKNDDDSSAVTFWGKQSLKKVLQKAQDLLDEHYTKQERAANNGPRGKTIGQNPRGNRTKVTR